MPLRSGPFPAVAALALLAGCGPAVQRLDASADFIPPSPVQVPRTVGIVHTPAFVAFAPDVRGTGHARQVFPLGETSSQLLAALYPSVFRRAVVVTSRASLDAGQEVDAVLEPAIEGFELSVSPFVANRWIAWAHVAYRFTLWSSSGNRLASWTILGRGEAGTIGTIPAGDDAGKKAVERAVRDAAHRFLLAFLDVPEARRWARGMAADGATVRDAAQMTTHGSRVETRHPGVVGIEAAFVSDAERRVTSVNLRVVNEGRRRLLISPRDITLEAGQQAVRPMPVAALASAFTASWGRVGPAPPFAGVGTSGIQAMAAANLVGALINLALTIAEARQFDREMARYQAETTADARLWEEGSAEFVVHFRVAAAPGQALIVPVIDTDAATRYVVHIVVPEGT